MADFLLRAEIFLLLVRRGERRDIEGEQNHWYAISMLQCSRRTAWGVRGEEDDAEALCHAKQLMIHQGDTIGRWSAQWCRQITSTIVQLELTSLFFDLSSCLVSSLSRFVSCPSELFLILLSYGVRRVTMCRHFVVLGKDGTSIFVSRHTKQHLFDLKQNGSVRCATFSPCGKYYMSAGGMHGEEPKSHAGQTRRSDELQYFNRVALVGGDAR